MRNWIVAVAMLLAAGPLAAQRTTLPLPSRGVVSLRPACTTSREGHTYYSTNAVSRGNCSTSTGTATAHCMCRGGNWVTAASTWRTEDIGTDETDTALVPHPDGSGGVEWGVDDTTAGSNDIDDYSVYEPISSLCTLVGWYDANALGLANNDPVGTWTDSSAAGNDITQSTSANKPTFKTGIKNSLPAVLFDGTNDCLADTSVGIGTFAAFAVFRNNNFGILYEQSANAGSNDGSFIYTDDSYGYVRRSAVLSQRFPLNNGWARDDTWHVVMQEFDGTHAGHRIWVDGAFRQTTITSSAISSTSTVTAALNVGCRNNASTYLGGYIAELVICSPQPSITNEMRILHILGTKWGLWN